jgi:hypothetical protein
LVLYFNCVGKGDVCDGKEPKDKNKSKMIFICKSRGTRKFVQEKKPCSGPIHLW